MIIWDNNCEKANFKVKIHLICILMSGHLGFVVVLVTGFYTHTITLCLSVFVITDHKSINLVVTEPDFQISTLDIFFPPQNQIFTIFPKKTPRKL